MTHTLRHWGRRIRREWKLFLLLTLLWYAALVVGHQLLGADGRSAARPEVSPTPAEQARPAA